MTGTLTTEEAATLLGVSPRTVELWVRRGYLAPVRPGGRPSLFRAHDVVECQLARRSTTWHQRLDALWRTVGDR